MCVKQYENSLRCVVFHCCSLRETQGKVRRKVRAELKQREVDVTLGNLEDAIAILGKIQQGKPAGFKLMSGPEKRLRDFVKSIPEEQKKLSEQQPTNKQSDFFEKYTIEQRKALDDRIGENERLVMYNSSVAPHSLDEDKTANILYCVNCGAQTPESDVVRPKCKHILCPGCAKFAVKGAGEKAGKCPVAKCSSKLDKGCLRREEKRDACFKCGDKQVMDKQHSGCGFFWCQRHEAEAMDTLYNNCGTILQ